MVLEKEEEKSKGWWGVHSQKSRMVIWTPEEGFYIYIVCHPFLQPQLDMNVKETDFRTSHCPTERTGKQFTARRDYQIK